MLPIMHPPSCHSCFVPHVRAVNRPDCHLSAGKRFSNPAVVALAWLTWCFLGAALQPAPAQVVFSEIMYHPVEAPAFHPDGTPVLDLSGDVHEFVELHNVSGEPVALAGWRLTSGISYEFPSDAVIGPGEYKVVAKNPERLAQIPEYSLTVGELFGPFDGQLSNSGELLRLRNAANEIVDAVTYADSFPWAISADGLGAAERWTGLNPEDFRYRGRSLERVSFTHPADDPANWLASPLPGNPSPGQPNAVARPVPKPVGTSFAVYQNSNEQPVIRPGQAVRVDCEFSATNELSNVSIEYYVVDLNAVGVTTTTLAMTPVGDPAHAKYTVLLPPFSARQVIRYRFRADRGDGGEQVSPRLDDPFAWHAFFVTPVRGSAHPIYDLFISDASWNTLAANINFSLDQRRIVPPDPPGLPRESWDATEPAIFVHDNVVYDIHMRHRGSRWNRAANRNAFKFYFPRYARFRDSGSWLVTDKGNDTVAGHGLFRAAGIPTSTTRWVSLYRNNTAPLTRLELEVNDDKMLERFHHEQSLLEPGLPVPLPGEIYKSEGSIFDEGPYGRGDGALLPPRSIWAPIERYSWTYNLKNNDWKGYTPLQEMMEGMWQARGGKITGLTALDIANLREYFLAHWDVDHTLTYLALINWMAPWDDIFHNYFLWRHSPGKWGLVPWDFDGMFGSPSASIFAGEVNDPSNNFRGHNYFKDSFIKAFREELKERLFLLNHTLLHPENISALGYGQFRSFADARFVAINNQVGLGVFQQPHQPSHIAPTNGQVILPPFTLTTSPYTHTAAPARPHAATTWRIRAADGSYQAPVVHLTSTNQLTELPVPFAQLQFGKTYCWNVIYHDADGHPSVASPETSFAFGQGSATVPLLEITANSSWKYNQTASFANNQTEWRERDYDDSSWPSGAPLLAFGNFPLPEPIRTPLTAGRLTYYFRTAFDFPGTGAAVLRLRHILDDGAVFYLNGTELFRYNLPAGAIGYTNLATSAIATAAYSDWFEVAVADLLPIGNVLAVEVHQATAGSSDLAFGVAAAVEVAGPPAWLLTPTAPYLLPAWNADQPAGTHPPNMLFYQVANSPGDPGLTDEMDSLWLLPYNLTSRSRITGLGAAGFAFINTGNAQTNAGAGFVGTAVLALDTREQQNLRVTWTGGTVTPNSRVYAIRLQYRLGASGPFTDVLDAENHPIEYPRNAQAGHAQTFGPITLPAVLNDHPYVQLRWKYYHVSGTSGARAELRVAGIRVSIAPPVPEFSSVFVAGATVHFTFASASGYTYQLLYKDHLNDPAWLPLGLPISGTGATLELTDASAPQPQRFYRLTVLE
jgi:hypothetical protein